MNIEEKYPIGTVVVHEDYGLGRVIDFENGMNRVLLEFVKKHRRCHNGRGFSKYGTVGQEKSCWYAFEEEFEPHKVFNNKLNKKLYPNRVEYKGFLVPAFSGLKKTRINEKTLPIPFANKHVQRMRKKVVLRQSRKNKTSLWIKCLAVWWGYRRSN